MMKNRIRAIVGMGLITSALGLGAVELASTASAAPVNNAPQFLYCQVYNAYGTPIYWYYGPCR
jgi:hypothetical protein